MRLLPFRYESLALLMVFLSHELTTPNYLSFLQRTYRLYRTLGLRFLCVVNHNNQVVGIITREDLLPGALADSILRGRNTHASIS